MSVDQQTASQEMSERIAQTLFSTVAKDLGVLPEQVFAEYGPKSVLTSADATRTADGKLQVTSDRAKQLFSLQETQGSFHQKRLQKLDSTKAEIREFLKSVRKSRQKGEKEGFIPLGEVSPVLREMIHEALGIDVTGYKHVLVESAVSHIRNRHGASSIEASRGQLAVTEADFEGLPELLENPDSLAVDKAYNTGSQPKIRITKQTRDGVYTIVEIILSGKKRKSLKVVTLWKDATTVGLGARDEAHRPIQRAKRPTPVAEGNIEELTEVVNPLKKAFPQGTIGEWFPDVRAIATWTGANRSTFLHETGHMFLDMRTKIAVKLKAKKDSGVELTKGEQHLLNSLEATMEWLGTDLDSFSKMSVDQQRPMHEKFAQTFVSFLLGSCPAPVLGSSVPEMLCHRYQKAFGAEENPRVLAKAELVISEMLTYYHETPTWVFPVLWKSMQVQNRETVCQAT